MPTRTPWWIILAVCFTCLCLVGCGLSEYNSRYEDYLRGSGDMLQPEAARTKFPDLASPTISIRLPKFIDASAKSAAGVPEELQLPFPTRFQFGYAKTLVGANPEDVEVLFLESAALKGELIDSELPRVMQANTPENPKTVEKLDLPVAGGKPLSLRYYVGTIKTPTQPGRRNSPTIDKRLAFYFYEQPGKTLAIIWMASTEADAKVHFFDAAKQSMGTLVYDPTAGAKAPPKPGGAAPAGGAAGAPAGLPAGGVLPAVPAPGAAAPVK